MYLEVVVFTSGHFLFMGISFVIVTLGILICNRKKPSIRNMLIGCLGLSLISELLKVLDAISIVPVVQPVMENGVIIYQETGAFTPYLEAEHFPFELCSYQIIFMLLALLVSNRKWLKRLYALMYTTCVIGGGLGILLSSAAIGLTDIMEFVASASVWRAFLYHSMLVVLGVYIGRSEECNVRFRDVKWTIVIVLCLDFASLYLNSMMSTPYYRGDELIGVGNAINYFSSYNNPLGIVMSEKTHWLIYLLLRLTGGAILILLVNLPLKKKERRKR